MKVFVKQAPEGGSGPGDALAGAVDGVLTALEKPHRVLGATVAGNPHGAGWCLPEAIPGDRVVIFSGTLADALFEPHPFNWMPRGRAALDRLCDRLLPRLSGGSRLCFQPHARHVLSDVPSCRQFLADHGGEPIDVALAPAGMLEPSMLTELDDHLQRQFEALGAVCGLLVLSDLMVSADGEGCDAVPLGEGRLPPEHVRRLIERHVPPETPIVISPERLDRQRAWLGVEATG